MVKVAALSLVLSLAASICNAAKRKVPESPGSTSETTGQNVFKEFWKNYTKVWTANSTIPYYLCEWQEPTNMSDNGLQIITHFDTTNSFTLNWTFAANNSMESDFSDGIFRRYMVYQNWTCAVFRDEFWRKLTLEEQKGGLTEQNNKKRRKREKRKSTKAPKVSVKLSFTSVDYRMVFDNTKKGHVPDDCRSKYREVINTAKNYRIYKKACKMTQGPEKPFTLTVGI
uniref:Putative group i salivary lipocalin n=1 Tax=Rhipicephalus microplus TaxID=6941 RepID=A0A6G5A3J9_RHIMP